jgi:hypothetical protein
MFKHHRKTDTMNDTQLNALKDFARQHGANWKQALYQFWLTGRDSGALRQIRNNFMPLVMSSKFKLGE